MLVIAAEHSGDQHAALGVSELQSLQPGYRICALGGPALEESGVQLLMDLTKDSAIGFQAIYKWKFYLKLISEVVRWVTEYQPKIICFVDSSGLNLRIAKALFSHGLITKAGGPIKAVYYIGPQIWASRAYRRFSMAKYIDELAVIFPFDQNYYSDTDLLVRFVGHPFLNETEAPLVDYDPTGPILLLPGSRKLAVSYIFPLLLEGYRLYLKGNNDREAVVVYPGEDVRRVIEKTMHTPYLLVPSGKRVAASAVLMSSGTMSLRCALAGVPGAIVYRTHPVTYLLGRLLVKVPYIGIANFLLGETMYPEYIQGEATPSKLSNQLYSSIHDREWIAKIRTQAERLRTLLSIPSQGSVGEWFAEKLAQ